MAQPAININVPKTKGKTTVVYTRTSSDVPDAKAVEPKKTKKRDPSKPCIVCKATFCMSKTCKAERKRIREIRRAKRTAKADATKKVTFAPGSGGSTSTGAPPVINIKPVVTKPAPKPEPPKSAPKVTVYQIKLAKQEPKPEPKPEPAKPKRVAVELVSSSSSVTVESSKPVVVYQPVKAAKEHAHDHRPAEVCHCRDKVEHTCQAKSHCRSSVSDGERPLELVLQAAPETCSCRETVEHNCRAKHHRPTELLVCSCKDKLDQGCKAKHHRAQSQVVELTVCKCGQVKSGCKCVTVQPARHCLGKCPVGHCTCLELQLAEQKRHDHGPRIPLANCRCGRFGGAGCTCGMEGLIQMQMAQCGAPCGPAMQGGLPIVFPGVGLGGLPGLGGQPSVVIAPLNGTSFSIPNPQAKIAITGAVPGSTVVASLVTITGIGMQITDTKVAMVGADSSFTIPIPGVGGGPIIPLQQTTVSVISVNGLQVASNSIIYTVV